MVAPPLHRPVLLHEVVTELDPRPGECVVDGTVGEGGHACGLVQKLEDRGTFLGIDGNAVSLGRATERIRACVNPGIRVVTEHANFTDLPAILARRKVPKPNVLLLDLGFSSAELEGYGLSFQRSEPLDMRYGIFSGKVTAAEIVNRSSPDVLGQILRSFGEDRNANLVARAIIRTRRKEPIRTTAQLARVITEALPKRYRTMRIHPATRTFQALRIAVNRELENLEAVLRLLPTSIAPGGRAAVISFHSLEDRVVKRSFREYAVSGVATLRTVKPIVPSRREIRENPRSRSAKLRVVEFLSGNR